ncbi:MAG: clan AA aspartic protease [Leptolyngbyaceae cyanobacterium RU_5_1]|nr:clan AA aspartic protease [Leptolyngbyaceae cyanobacterium RU_5_1]
MSKAVRVKVKLTNAIAKALVNRGSLAPRHLRECEAEGLVDTGALTLVVPPKIAQQLGLKIQGQQIARYANDYEEPVGVTEPVNIELEGRKTTLEALVVGDEVLIGQVVLELLDLLPDCKNQRLIPNLKNPDYPVAIIK